MKTVIMNQQSNARRLRNKNGKHVKCINMSFFSVLAGKNCQAVGEELRWKTNHNSNLNSDRKSKILGKRTGQLE